MMFSRRAAVSLLGTGVVGLLSCGKTGPENHDDTDSTRDTGADGVSSNGDSADTSAADTGGHSGTDTADGIDSADTGGASEVCSPTPTMGLGPFYREDPPVRENLNPLEEKGTRIRIEGRVVSDDCRPLPDATLDVWHCAPEVVYDMKSKEYRFRARVPLDKDGRFGFETIRPPNYYDEMDGKLQIIVAHIHYLVSAGGHQTLASQSYFDDDPVLGNEPKPLVLSFSDDGSGLLVAQHEITLTPEVDTGS